MNFIMFASELIIDQNVTKGFQKFLIFEIDSHATLTILLNI